MVTLRSKSSLRRRETQWADAPEDLGYPDFMHAFGQRVWRKVHDDGSMLDSHREKYGDPLDAPVKSNGASFIEPSAMVGGPSAKSALKKMCWRWIKVRSI